LVLLTNFCNLNPAFSANVLVESPPHFKYFLLLGIRSSIFLLTLSNTSSRCLPSLFNKKRIHSINPLKPFLHALAKDWSNLRKNKNRFLRSGLENLD